MFNKKNLNKFIILVFILTLIIGITKPISLKDISADDSITTIDLTGLATGETVEHNCIFESTYDKNSH